MEGMDKCSSWGIGIKGAISYVRGRLLAAFQDLKTITNEVEVHGIILREVVGINSDGLFIRND